jgi:hypothetical protein
MMQRILSFTLGLSVITIRAECGVGSRPHFLFFLDFSQSCKTNLQVEDTNHNFTKQTSQHWKHNQLKPSPKSKPRSPTMNSQSPSKYDMRLNPVYQVDWQNAASGKRLSATKRRVVWRFGFSNAEAITQGLTGMNCRGEEHEISVVWSLTSGKRLVTADGQEVHFSFGKRTDTKFETSWTMSGGHILKVINHATPPLLQTPGFRQFDLLLDGCSFFDMPKIYELGTPKANKLSMARVRKSPAVAYNNYSVPISPDYDQESFGYSKGSKGGDFYRAPTTPVRQSARAIEHQHQFATPAPSTRSAPIDMISEPTPLSYVEDYFDAPPTFTLQAQADEFTPAPAQPPSFGAKSSQIMSTYTPHANTAVLALANESHTYMQQPQQSYQQQQPQQTYQQQPHQPQQQQQQPHQQQHPYHQTYSQALVPLSLDISDSSMQSSSPQVITPTMAPLSMEELESREGPPMSDMEKALKALVNFDDISETIVTPEQRKAEEKKMQVKPKKSKPLPPTAPEWHLGSKAALGDIKKFTPPKAPAKEIMITHAFDPAAVQAGMLVVYGSTIPQAQGFGYGYQQQQQQQQQMARYRYMQQQGQMASVA